MPFGAALTFDPKTDLELQALWQAQVDAGLPASMAGIEYPPHMTLLLAEDGDFDGLRDAFQNFASQTMPLQVSFLALGVFPAEFGVVYLAPVANQALLALHASIWDVSIPHLSRLFDYYKPGVWVPHVTLANKLQLDQIGPVAGFLAGSAWPRSGTITRILYGEFQPGGVNRLEAVSLVGEGN